MNDVAVWIWRVLILGAIVYQNIWIGLIAGDVQQVRSDTQSIYENTKFVNDTIMRRGW